MPTKKQRRRQQKGRRHEYEVVYLDADGNEIAPADAPAETRAREKPARKETAGRRPSTRGGRTVQPPSWRRVLKRGAIFAPLMYIVVTLVDSGEMTAQQRVGQTVFLLLVFLPFSYLMDTLTYRIWKRRADPDGGSR